MKRFSFFKASVLLLLLLNAFGIESTAQELNCKVKIIHSKIQSSSTIFKTLEEAISDFMNNRAWTNLQFGKNEKIDCSISITLTLYNQNENTFQGEMKLQCTRPVFNSSYNTVVFSSTDRDINFTYKEYDPLEFNEINAADDNLTAILAYYAYLFIGLDLDTFSPLGGTDVLHAAENIVNNAQSRDDPGWNAFGETRNRHSIINDYMENSMETYRKIQYQYHRLGLDEMSNNPDRGRNQITETIEMLNQVYKDNQLSSLPTIFTDYKRDELVNIYRGHGTENEKTKVSDILSDINPSQGNEWNRIKR